MNASRTLIPTPELPLPETPTTARSTLVNILLACGALYSLSYIVVNDVIAATRYRGYSRISQAISELSATAAPTRSLLSASVPFFTVLLVAFGLGVWGSARGQRALRVTGALLIAHAATFPLWLLAPMTTREEMGTTMAGNDLGHILLTVMTVTLILLQLGFGAAAFGKRFRRYSLASATAVIGFGVLTAIQSAKVPTGEPTPWLGLVERISIGSWLVWVAVLAVALLQRHHAQIGILSSNTTGRS